MDAAAWQKAKPLIADALELPPGQRGAFLETKCADPALRAEIRAYLESGDQPTVSARPGSSDGQDASDRADLQPGGSGIRAKLHGPEATFADFLIERDARNPCVIQAAGIDSPGLTSCLAIGDMVAELAAETA